MKIIKRIFVIALILAIGIGIGLLLAHIHNNAVILEAYSDNAIDILEQHSLLLNQTADILWNTPEAFYAVQEDGESYSHFTTDELFSYSQIYNCFSPDELHLLQDVISTTQLCTIGMYYPMYGRAQAVSFTFECADKYKKRLIYIRAVDDNDGYTSEQQVENLLEYISWDWVDYLPTNYPNWYAEIRSTDSPLSH